THLLPRMFRQQQRRMGRKDRTHRSTEPWAGQLQRMDGNSVVSAPYRNRRTKGREVADRGGWRPLQNAAQPSHRKGRGRCAGGVGTERRSAPPRAGLSFTACRARLGGKHQREVAAAAEGGR